MADQIAEFDSEEFRDHMAEDHAALGYDFRATDEEVMRRYHDRDHRRFQSRLGHAHEEPDDE